MRMITVLWQWRNADDQCYDSDVTRMITGEPCRYDVLRELFRSSALLLFDEDGRSVGQCIHANDDLQHRFYYN